MAYQKRGNPFKKGNTYMFYYQLKDGPMKYRCGFPTKTSAKKAMKLLQSKIDAGYYAPDFKISVADYSCNWYEDRCKPDITYNTARTYENALYNYMIPFFGKRKLHTLNRSVIISLYDNVCKKSPNVARIVKTLMNSIVEAAIEDKHLLNNPARKIKLTVLPHKPVKVNLSEEQISKFLQASIGSSLELEVHLAYGLGVRKGELLGMKFSDVDYTTGTIHIQRTLDRDNYSPEEYELRKAERSLTKAEKKVKTASSNRFVKAPAIILEMIQEREQQCEHNRAMYGGRYNEGGYICCTKFGNPRSRNSHWVVFKRLLAEAGLPDIAWHKLRSINASHLYARGIGTKVIKEELGHASQEMTHGRYINTGPLEMAAVECVADFLFSSSVQESAS